MSFLFPLYLLGAAAVAVPVLLHLRRRLPKDSVAFSSLMFLDKSPQRLTRRTRIERWFLLALRCLALIAFALLFGRPFFKSVSLSDAATGSRVVILVDRSASMRREDLWQQALSASEKAVKSFSNDDEIAMAVFDTDLELVGDFESWKGMSPSSRWSSLQSWLGGHKEGNPSWRTTDIGMALTEAVDLLAGSEVDMREIILISDFQEGAERNSLNQLAWPPEIKVRCIQVSVREQGNLSVNLAASSKPGDDSSLQEDHKTSYRVRVSNSIESDNENFTIEWEGYPETRIDSFLPPGSSRVMSSPPRPADSEKGVLLISGDHHDFDNRVYVATAQPRPLPILFLADKIERGKAGTPLFYLERAMNETASLAPVMRAKTFTEVSDDWEKSEVIVVHGDWPEPIAEKLHLFVEKGGLVIALPSPETDSGSFATLLGEPNWKLSEAKLDLGYVMLNELDFEHPVLVPFARAKMRDFTKIRFWKTRALAMPNGSDKSTSIFAEFDSGTPAWLEKKIGKGSVVAFLSGWEPRESQLALSSKFVPILYSILENAGYHSRSAPTRYVDEGRHPSPGFYQEEKKTFAVNLYPTEGNTSTFDPDMVLPGFGVALSDGPDKTPSAGSENDKSKRRLEAEEKENRQKLWKWLVVFVLVVLIIETWLAGKNRRTALSI